MLPFEILHCFCSLKRVTLAVLKMWIFGGERLRLWNVAVGSEQGGGMPPLSPPTLPPALKHCFARSCNAESDSCHLNSWYAFSSEGIILSLDMGHTDVFHRPPSLCVCIIHGIISIETEILIFYCLSP